MTTNKSFEVAIERYLRNIVSSIYYTVLIFYLINYSNI